MKYNLYSLLFILIVIVSCNKIQTIGIENKWYTKYRIHYSSSYRQTYEIYTDSMAFICSFQGTNYLLEKGNSEELLSTTAPIEIIDTHKINENNK